jgi:3' exoribonuclease, RNase T-like
MKYYIDSEFADDGSTIDLVSIGIVAEDGRELYLQSTEFDHRKASTWVKENVLTHLVMCPWAEPSKKGIPGLYRTDKAYHKKYGQCVDQQRGYIHNCPWRTRMQLAREIKTFIDVEDGKPELIGWCSAYDWVALCQLYGPMMDLPDGWPHYIRDLQHVLDDRGISDDELPPQEEGLHNALADAQHIKKLWGYIVRNDCWQ